MEILHPCHDDVAATLHPPQTVPPPRI